MFSIKCAATGLTKKGITLGLLDALHSGIDIILRTENSPAAELLRNDSIPFDTLDYIYRESEDFSEVNSACAMEILRRAEKKDVLYCVFDLRDASVAEILRKRPDTMLIAGVNEESALYAFAGDDALCINASDLDTAILDSHHSLLIRELDSRYLASECKLCICDCYSEESECIALFDGMIHRLPVYEIDRLPEGAYSHSLSICVPKADSLDSIERYGQSHLLDIIRKLCSPDGDPSFRNITHESIRKDLIESAYEVGNSAYREDPLDIAENLGKLLFYVLLHTVIAEKHSEWGLRDVTSSICKRIISAYPKVFGGDHIPDVKPYPMPKPTDPVREEMSLPVYDELISVPRDLPTLAKAYEICCKAFGAGFGSSDIPEAIEHIRSEVAELIREEPGTDKASEELGDLLLAVCAASVRYECDPEIALERSLSKYLRRFRAMEEKLSAKGLSFADSDAGLLDLLWQSVKKEEAEQSNL